MKLKTFSRKVGSKDGLMKGTFVIGVIDKTCFKAKSNGTGEGHVTLGNNLQSERTSNLNVLYCSDPINLSQERELNRSNPSHFVTVVAVLDELVNVTNCNKARHFGSFVEASNPRKLICCSLITSK